MFCWFGKHDWIYWRALVPPKRRCGRCKKEQFFDHRWLEWIDETVQDMTGAEMRLQAFSRPALILGVIALILYWAFLMGRIDGRIDAGFECIERHISIAGDKQ